MEENPLKPDQMVRIIQESLEQTVRSLQTLQEGVVSDIREACGKISPGQSFKPGNFETVEKELAEQQAQMVERLEEITSGLVNNEIFTGVSQTVEAAAKSFEEILKKFSGE
ncbi:hypothetical protein [Desulfatibacillum aliphaticivorans]|uniref:Uncharacterized protein n=1 Tax=Desulfatibacillum aliphaticivorans TaxID=218208 RepID=B8FC78_DESAL|nr:hypothetical protein [Desulfatibacillum aliphaticivorans]ACL05496.1 hypothetical protein Dalk_3810 [Desulfatibacillum aliphaticivorans]